MNVLFLNILHEWYQNLVIMFRVLQYTFSLFCTFFLSCSVLLSSFKGGNITFCLILLLFWACAGTGANLSRQIWIFTGPLNLRLQVCVKSWDFWQILRNWNVRTEKPNGTTEGSRCAANLKYTGPNFFKFISIGMTV